MIAGALIMNNALVKFLVVNRVNVFAIYGFIAKAFSKFKEKTEAQLLLVLLK